MSKLFTIIRNIGILLLLALSGTMLVLSLPSSGWKALSVQTGSMKPAIFPGDLVLSHKTAIADIRVGDVITYVSPKNNRQTITHRVQSVQTVTDGPGRFITKGDANSAADQMVYQNQIVGTAKLTVPKVGIVFDWLRTWTGLIIVIYIPSLFIVLAETKRLTKYYKDMEPYAIAGFNPKKPASGQAKRLAAGLAITTAAVGLTVPAVEAALMSTAGLTNNTISSVSASSLNHLVITKVSFGNNGSNTSSNTNITVTNNNSQTATTGNASSSSGGATSGNASNTNNQSVSFSVSGTSDQTTPQQVVTIYNPTNSPVTISGWTLTDNTGSQTIPTSTTLLAKASYSFTWPQSGGLSKLGDRLLLRNTGGTAVDSLSWGTDTTYLNPAVVINTASAGINRSDSSKDTDTASDWTNF